MLFFQLVVVLSLAVFLYANAAENLRGVARKLTTSADPLVSADQLTSARKLTTSADPLVSADQLTSARKLTTSADKVDVPSSPRLLSKKHHNTAVDHFGVVVNHQKEVRKKLKIVSRNKK